MSAKHEQELSKTQTPRGLLIAAGGSGQQSEKEKDYCWKARFTRTHNQNKVVFGKANIEAKAGRGDVAGRGD